MCDIIVNIKIIPIHDFAGHGVDADFFIAKLFIYAFLASSLFVPMKKKTILPSMLCILFILSQLDRL